MFRFRPGRTARPRPLPAEGRDPVEEVPPVWRLAVYGFQHVLAFYAGAVVMPLLVAEGIGLRGADVAALINASLLACGISTILQSVGLPGVGIRLPVVQGMSTTAVPSLVSVGVAAGGARAGLPTVFGAVIAAGLAMFLIAPVFSRLVRFFPPVVTGSILVVIGVTLLAVAARQVGGGDAQAHDFGSPAHLGFAAVPLAVIVLLNKVSRGFLATVAVGIGLAVGTLLAALAGRADFSGIGDASWIGASAPLHYGAPRWDTMAVLSLLLVMVIIAAESIGQFFAVGRIVGRDPDGRQIVRALRADGLATGVAGVLNSFPTTVYSQNIGLIRLTRVRSRWVVAASGVLMLVLGLMPKIGAVIAAMPASVLGGATLVLFGTIAVVGVQILRRADLADQRNTILVAASLGIGFLPTAYPQFAQRMPGEQLHALFESGIILGTLSAVLFNLFFHHVPVPWRRGKPDPESAAQDEADPASTPTGPARTGIDAPEDYMQHEIPVREKT
ncbi:nucleobase:cation symporter-2 family protein [Streptomyces cacaoi]|uniref:nucleobase:cation symporter-2 family protein n=1 Tax=Streptomyces cacaoi TaxID=1898 RepID=UPI00261453A1|nr:nucleobase:cation symporter-2 family protein [Streptomyces cacaoi]